MVANDQLLCPPCGLSQAFRFPFFRSTESSAFFLAIMIYLVLTLLEYTKSGSSARSDALVPERQGKSIAQAVYR